MKLYDNLKAEMSRNGITGTELAAILHISNQSFYQKMNGKTDFTLKQVLSIQYYLNHINPSVNYTLDYLFKG